MTKYEQLERRLRWLTRSSLTSISTVVSLTLSILWTARQEVTHYELIDISLMTLPIKKYFTHDPTTKNINNTSCYITIIYI